MIIYLESVLPTMDNVAYIPVASSDPSRRSKSKPDKRGSVTIRTKDRARFAAFARQAATACGVSDRKKQTTFRRQFENLVDFLGDWVRNRRAKLAKAFLTVQDSGLVLIIVSKEKAYNAGLERDLTQLDIKVAQSKDFSEVCLCVQALPCCSKSGYEHFCNPKATLEFTGLPVSSGVERNVE
jgi:hypothetical protein